MICWFIAGGPERSIAKADVERHRRRRVSAAACVYVGGGARYGAAARQSRRYFNNRAGKAEAEAALV